MSIFTEIERIKSAKADLRSSILAKGGTVTADTLPAIAEGIRTLPAPTVSYGSVTYYSSFSISWGGGWEMPIVDESKFAAIAIGLMGGIPYNTEGGMMGGIMGRYESGTLYLECYTETGMETWEGTGEEAGIDTSMAEEQGMGWDEYYIESCEKTGTSTVELETESDLLQFVADVQEESQYGETRYYVNNEKTISLSTGEKFRYGYIKKFEFGSYSNEYPDNFLVTYSMTEVAGTEKVELVGDNFMMWCEDQSMQWGGGEPEYWENPLTSIGGFDKLVEAGDNFLSRRDNLQSWPDDFSSLVTVGDNFMSSGNEWGGGGYGSERFALPTFPCLETVGDNFMMGLSTVHFPGGVNEYSFDSLTTIGKKFLYRCSQLWNNDSYALTLRFPLLTVANTWMMGETSGSSSETICWHEILLPSLVTLYPGFMETYYGQNSAKIYFGANFSEFGEDSEYWGETWYMPGMLLSSIYTEATNPPEDPGADKFCGDRNSQPWISLYGSQQDKWLETYPNVEEGEYYRHFEKS